MLPECEQHVDCFQPDKAGLPGHGSWRFSLLLRQEFACVLCTSTLLCRLFSLCVTSYFRVWFLVCRRPPPPPPSYATLRKFHPPGRSLRFHPFTVRTLISLFLEQKPIMKAAEALVSPLRKMVRYEKRQGRGIVAVGFSTGGRQLLQ